jgi:hypothetical protein
MERYFLQADAMNNDYVWILTESEPPSPTNDGSRGETQPNPFSNQPKSPAPPITPYSLQRVPVQAEKLERGMSDFLQVVGRVFTRAQESAKELGGMELDEIELGVEINGEGQFSLLGNGGKLGGKGAMTLKFKKANPK